VNPDGNVFMEASHGMSVLSIISSNIPGQLIGTAPDASFWLLRSEDVHSEYLIEEDNWIAAAEFADSAGADIITSSLGYSLFDNPAQNHTYQDMDGNTTRVSIAADMAASRGMLVVASAGNQGLTEWKYITAPADADSILTIGAVDFTGMITEFSSRGPSYDLRVKPTVDAIGMYTYIINPNGSVGQGDGTSFSAPVIAGLSACLWQSNPQASMMDIYNAICSSADRYYIPDDFYGYGIPNFSIADYLLKTANQSKAGNGFKVFPNPFTDKFYIVFDEPVNSAISITFYDLTGKEVDHFNYPEAPERRYILFENSLRYLPKGLYIVKVSAENISDNAKLVKY
jgi:subtilisin family serine protease